jgi:hypothetical protein
MQQIGAFMAGGYVAGRMRSRWRETGDESDFRDGLHGGLVWAVGVTIGALIFLSTAGAVARTVPKSQARPALLQLPLQMIQWALSSTRCSGPRT